MSSFVEVRKCEGQKDGNGFPEKTRLLATVQSVGSVEFNPKTGKPFQQVTLDDGIESNKVKILGDKMGDGCISRKLAFDLSAYTSDKNGKTYYSGFYADRATVTPAKSPARTPTPPSATSKPPAPSNSTPYGEIGEDWARCKVLCAMLPNVSEGANKQAMLEEVLDYVKFVMTGKIESGEAERENTDDIPY